MKKDLLIEVDNFEKGEAGLILRTINGSQFQDKVHVTIAGQKMVVSITELKEALVNLEEFQETMEHPQDIELNKSAPLGVMDFEYKGDNE